MPVIPAVDATTGLLPPGRHAATLAEVFDVFVRGAPYFDERYRIWEAFTVWADLVSERFRGVRLWIDGGFVTLKQWAPPEDLDVMFLVKRSHALEVHEDRILELITHEGPRGGRVQAMGGLVDAFVVVRGEASLIDYWDNLWARVRGSDGNEVPGLTKGYLEVKL